MGATEFKPKIRKRYQTNQLAVDSTEFGTRGSEVQILSPRPIFLSPVQLLTQLSCSSFWLCFSVLSVQLRPKAAIRSRFRTPRPSAEAPRCLSPCRTDRPSNFPRVPTSSRVDLWDTKSRSSGTYYGSAGRRGFPPYDRPCAGLRTQVSSVPDAGGDEERWSATAVSRSRFGTRIRWCASR